VRRFGEETALAAELRTHGVAALSVDDLATLLNAGSDPAEMRALFEPGIAADRLSTCCGSASTANPSASRWSASGWLPQPSASKSCATTEDPQRRADPE
jgi:hypothetical protein